MKRGVAIARDFAINSLGRIALVGGSDGLFQNLFKFFETQFRSLAFRKIDIQYPETLEDGVRALAQSYVDSQRQVINLEFFDGDELVQDIVVTDVEQQDLDRFRVNMVVTLNDGTTFGLPSNIRLG